MDCERIIERNINLNRLFYEDFRQFPYLLWSECRILSNCQTFKTGTPIAQHNRPKSCATSSIRQQFVNKSLKQNRT